MRKPVYVLGTGLSHNGSSCLLEDGKILVAAEKERLTQKKNDGGNDAFTVQYCLNVAGIQARDLDLIVQNANFGAFRYGNGWYKGARQLPDGVPIVTISHHLAHAYAAYFLSPFDEAAVLVVDGCGNAFEDCMDLQGTALAEQPTGDMTALWFEKDSYYRAGNSTITPIFKDFSPWGLVATGYPLVPRTTRHSIGGTYQAASSYIFGSSADLGKLMGLAPYGRTRSHDQAIFTITDGRVFVNYNWIERRDERNTSEANFKARFQGFADLARRVQSEVERAVLAVVRARYQRSPSENLCFSGGVALNAVANRRILEETPFKRLFVPPASDDSGLAVGCAYYGWHAVLQRERVRHSGATFFGREYDSAAIEAALRAHPDGLTFERPDNVVEPVAAALEAGQTVAWFRGRAEFGPRALGHRSILGDPRNAALRDYINSNVKFREEFRPFAPSVLAEDASQYFELDVDSPYMLLVVPVRPDWRQRIPAVVHVDGTARVQTVTAETDCTFHALLTEFKRRTGLGMLLNTSLNRRGMPIVETPAQAITMFKETGLHLLAIGDFLVRKTSAS